MTEKSDKIGIKYALKGVKAAFATEKNLRIELVIGALVMIFGLALRVSLLELAILVIAIGFVLAAELFNSAIELVVDYISLERNELAGRIKDISAAAVLVCAVISVIVGLCIFLPKINILLNMPKAI